MKKRTIIILVVAFVAVVFGVLRAARLTKFSEATAEDKGGVFKPAPDFTLLDIHGNKKSLSDFKGKVVILDFWATWCPPCRKEIPHFVELYDDYKERGLEIIGVALDKDGEKVVSLFINENGIDYTVLLGDREVSNLYGGIPYIPTTFIIDREGRIRKKYIGYRDKSVFENDIREIL